MKGLATLLVAASFAVPGHSKATHDPVCQARTFREFSAKVWAPTQWRRGEPPERTVAAAHRRLGCAGPANRAAMRKIWKRAGEHFRSHRSKMLWLVKYRPFVYPGGTRWAVPYPIAICESGGDYFVGPSGAYGLIPPFPQYMSPKEQDEVAANLYREMGDAPWAPYEGGCYLR